MSVNRYLPHVFILPEDDANHQMATGFEVNVDSTQIRTLTEAGGWRHVCDYFTETHVDEMRQYVERFMVLLIDFDDDAYRLEKVQAVIPEDLKSRVFVLGVRPEPEDLRRAGIGSYEAIGKKLADDCRNDIYTLWTRTP